MVFDTLVSPSWFPTLTKARFEFVSRKQIEELLRVHGQIEVVQFSGIKKCEIAKTIELVNLFCVYRPKRDEFLFIPHYINKYSYRYDHDRFVGCVRVATVNDFVLPDGDK